MGLLFVFQGEENTPVHHVDTGFDDWLAIIAAAKSTRGGFPLVRRLNDYYRDASFDADELNALLSELECLRTLDCGGLDPLIELVQAALAVDKGISAIAD